jgi:hypothetical protein
MRWVRDGERRDVEGVEDGDGGRRGDPTKEFTRDGMILFVHLPEVLKVSIEFIPASWKRSRYR